MSELKTNQGPGQNIEQMLKKVRSDSTWHGLTWEQCEKVERWLFEENRSYAETSELVKTHFGRETSTSSVGRFYSQRARVRRAMELMEAQVAADQLQVMPAKTADMREAAVKLLAKNAVILGMEKPGDVAGLMSMTKLLLESEENEIRLRRVKLEEQYYDLQANTIGAKELEKVRSYIKAVGDNEYLNEKAKIDLVVKLLYGKDKVDVEEVKELESINEQSSQSGSDNLENESSKRGEASPNEPGFPAIPG